jgi:WD40 repeat protein
MTVWSLSGDSTADVEKTLAFPTMARSADLAVASVDAESGGLCWLTLHGDAVFQWNPQTRKLEKSFRQASGLTEAAFSYDGKYVATASRSVVIWDAGNRRPLAKIEFPHSGPVATVSWDPSSPTRFATGGKDGGEGQPAQVKIWNWNPETHEVSQVSGFPVDVAINRVRWSADGAMLLAVGDDGFARVWKVADPNAPARLLSDAGSPSRSFLCGEFSPDSTKVLAGGDDGVACVWKLDGPTENDDKPWARLSGHADEISDVGFLSAPGEDGASVRYLTASHDKSARLWDVQDVANLTKTEPVRVREVLALRKHDLGLSSVKATADGQTLVTAGLDGRVILWPSGNGDL